MICEKIVMFDFILWQCNSFFFVYVCVADTLSSIMILSHNRYKCIICVLYKTGISNHRFHGILWVSYTKRNSWKTWRINHMFCMPRCLSLWHWIWQMTTPKLVALSWFSSLQQDCHVINEERCTCLLEINVYRRGCYWVCMVSYVYLNDAVMLK